MTEPLVPKEVDLRSFPFMAIDVVRLQRSKHWLIARQNPEIGFYSVNLWMAAWHELPAASLENDDDILSALAGCSLDRWKEVKNLVLRNWVLCSDGRLYHPVVAEKANEAWNKKLGRQKQTRAATSARNQKDSEKEPESENVTTDVTSNVTTDVTSTLDQETINVTRSIREEKRREDSSVLTNVRTDADASPVDPVKILFDEGIGLLGRYKIGDRQARALIGKWRKVVGDARLSEVFSRSGNQKRSDIVAFIEGCLAEQKQPTAQRLARNLQSMRGAPFSNENAEFHVEGWAKILGLESVSAELQRAKSSGWDRAKTMEHLDSLAGAKTRDNYQKPKEISQIEPAPEDPHWVAVRDQMIANVPGAKSWLGETVRSVYVNDQIVKIRAASRTCLEHIQGYSPRMLELFQIQKPGIEKIEVVM